jgi:hypothetical protein
LRKAAEWKRGRCDGKNLSFIENQICRYMTTADGSWDEGCWGESVLLSKVHATLKIQYCMLCLHHIVHSHRVKCENKFDIQNDKMYFYFKRTFIKDYKN